MPPNPRSSPLCNPRPFTSTLGLEILAITVLLVASSIAASSCARAESGELSLESCRPEGFGGEALCGTLQVPENPADPEGRWIDLRITVLPARGKATAPDPIFALAGGPGTAASGLAGLLSRSPLRERRDIVLVDQRGTGGSNPLDCTPEAVQDRLRMIFNLEALEMRTCQEKVQRHADPRFYTTPVAMDDLDAVREALGAQKINLWGGSYGTRAALIYLRRHGERVRTATLLGVAPPPLLLPLDFPRDAQAALDATFFACAADRACAEAHPDPHSQLDEVLGRLETRPVQVVTDVPGEGRVPVEMTRDLFTGTLRFTLYNTRTANRIPSWIASADRGDFEPVTRFAVRFGLPLLSRFHLGMTLAVLCSEEAPFLTAEALRRHAEGTFLGPAMGLHDLESCRTWPRGEIPAGYHDPVQSDVPVLLVSGAVDPVTPPRHAADAARHLSASRHLVIPGTGHYSIGNACVDQILREFVETGSTEGLDASCLESIRRPPFEG